MAKLKPCTTFQDPRPIPRTRSHLCKYASRCGHIHSSVHWFRDGRRNHSSHLRIDAETLPPPSIPFPRSLHYHPDSLRVLPPFYRHSIVRNRQSTILRDNLETLRVRQHERTESEDYKIHVSGSESVEREFRIYILGCGGFYKYERGVCLGVDYFHFGEFPEPLLSCW